ncbi:aspartate kinase [Rheinheimera texasensis]|uniref:aspartate kinase n=1 Tax=Rheinheimera texasensis TaxID=306205 RepID=UPI0004E263F6|nr:aspartate kinase [Rheinheimera texasensis]
MALLVQKFGGTSVGTTERIEAVAELIIRTVQAGHKVVAVVSAMAGDTNRLLGLAQQIDAKAAPRELDVLAAAGEQVSVALLAIALIKRGYPAVSLLADQVCIRTDNKFGRARIEEVETHRLQQELEQGHIVVVAGFQGRDFEGNLTTLGRGGSDTSAVALAAALQADECQIYTDVDGVYTIDPRICPAAQRLAYIPYSDMLELASVGAKVLHSRSVEYAGRFQVLLRVLSTFRPDAGTLMVYGEAPQQPLLSGIACQHGLTRIHLEQASPELTSSMLELLSSRNIDVDMVRTDTDSVQQAEWALANTDWQQVAEEARELLKICQGATLRSQANLAKLSVVGCGIGTQADIVTRVHQLFDSLNIELWAVYQTQTRLSVLMAAEQVDATAAKLHQVLFGSDN